MKKSQSLTIENSEQANSDIALKRATDIDTILLHVSCSILVFIHTEVQFVIHQLIYIF